MRHIILLILTCFICKVNFAQTGFYFEPLVGVGSSKISRVEGSKIACDCGMTLGTQSPELSFTAVAGIGYQFKIFRLATGLQIIRTGALSNIQYDYFPSGVRHTTTAQDEYSKYDNVLVPISFGFISIPLNKEWKLTPEIGTRIAILSQNNRSGGSGIFFHATVNFERELNNNMSLVISPSYYFIRTPDYYKIALDENEQQVNTINNVFMLQAGIIWHRYSKHAIPKDPVTH